MRFYQGLLPAVIWDKEIRAPSVEFKNGVFDTEDEKLIEMLTTKGYLTRVDIQTLEDGGTLDHGGFERQVFDEDLPSGRPPMDNPEIAGGDPLIAQARTMGPSADKLPSNENADLARHTASHRTTEAGNMLHEAPASTDQVTRKRDTAKKVGSKVKATKGKGKTKGKTKAKPKAKSGIKRRKKSSKK